MNKCLNCGKEIPEGRKFCSSSCSAKYNNVRRQRRPWTEEQRKNFSEKQVERLRPVSLAFQKSKKLECQCCGKEFNSRALHRYCPDCKQYSNTLPVLLKLGVWKKGDAVEKGILQAKKLLGREYFENRESLLTLSKKYGICKDTVKSYVGTVRTLSEANRNAVETGRHELYGNPQFKSGTHISWEGRKFHFRSSWEEEYMKQLDEQKVSYLYEPFSIRYYDTQRNEERVAIPDFFFPETNTIVELKSSFTYDEQNIRDKFQSYREKGYKAELLLDWQKIEI